MSVKTYVPFWANGLSKVMVMPIVELFEQPFGVTETMFTLPLGGEVNLKSEILIELQFASVSNGIVTDVEPHGTEKLLPAKFTGFRVTVT